MHPWTRHRFFSHSHFVRQVFWGCSYSLANPIPRFRREIGACSRRPRRAGLLLRAAYATYGTLSLMAA